MWKTPPPKKFHYLPIQWLSQNLLLRTVVQRCWLSYLHVSRRAYHLLAWVQRCCKVMARGKGKKTQKQRHGIQRKTTYCSPFQRMDFSSWVTVQQLQDPLWCDNSLHIRIWYCLLGFLALPLLPYVLLVFAIFLHNLIKFWLCTNPHLSSCHSHVVTNIIFTAFRTRK